MMDPELLAFRETFNLSDHLKGIKTKPAEAPPIQITREVALIAARHYGIAIVEGPGDVGGRALSAVERCIELEKQMAHVAAENHELKVANQSLAERCRIAETAARSASEPSRSGQQQPQEAIDV